MRESIETFNLVCRTAMRTVERMVRLVDPHGEWDPRCLLNICAADEFQLKTPQDDAIELWSMVGEEEDTLEIVRRSSELFYANVTTDGDEWRTLCRRLAGGFVCHEGEGCVVDAITAAEVPDRDELYDTLVTTPWLVFMIALATSDYFKDI